jgi:outer membrane protein assembly factor BamB
VKLSTPNRIETKVALSYPVPNYSSRAQAQPGRSFLSLNGVNWQDVTTIKYLENGTVCLKVFTVSDSSQSSGLGDSYQPVTMTSFGGLGDSYQPVAMTSYVGLGNNPQFFYDLNTGQSNYVGPQTNHTNWTYPVNDVISTAPAVSSDGTIYFGSADNNLYALDANGKLKWQFPTENSIWSSPVVASDGTVYFGSGDGNFYALDSQGNFKWSYDTSSPIFGDIIWSSPAIGGLPGKP